MVIEQVRYWEVIELLIDPKDIIGTGFQKVNKLSTNQPPDRHPRNRRSDIMSEYRRLKKCSQPPKWRKKS